MLKMIIGKKGITASLGLLGLSLAFIPGWSFAQNANSTNHPKIQVNGNGTSFSTIMDNDHILVPASFFSGLGVEVNWSSTYQAVLLKKKATQIAFPSDKNYIDATHTGIGNWKREYLSTTTKNRKDGTYIPLRYAAESMGMNIHYTAENNTVYIDTHPTTVSIKQDNQVNWLYKITEAEAGGESHQGKVAVAASILNRVKSPDWPNTIKGVIFQVVQNKGVNYYQYSPVQDGRIYQAKPTADTIQAVQEALNGNDPTDGALVFYNPNKTDNQWVRSKPVTAMIGNHLFAK